VKVKINDVELTLMPEKALYREDAKLLVIADVHLGKANHFRKAGIPIPAEAQKDDYTNLENLLRKTKAEQVYFLGDLFHSSFNRDWHFFTDLIALFPEVKFTLVKGNHDLINKTLFKKLGIEVVDKIEDEQFIYTHEPLARKRKKLNIAGHIHPGFAISGRARQHVKLPCFHLSNNQLILPAFGVLTGLFCLEKTGTTEIYAILPSGLRHIK
jgi:DNA ligase-associated metallophosphoesterase